MGRMYYLSENFQSFSHIFTASNLLIFFLPLSSPKVTSQHFSALPWFPFPGWVRHLFLSLPLSHTSSSSTEVLVFGIFLISYLLLFCLHLLTFSPQLLMPFQASSALPLPSHIAVFMSTLRHPSSWAQEDGRLIKSREGFVLCVVMEFLLSQYISGLQEFQILLPI